MLAKSPSIPLFTLNPPHGSGRRARKGFDLQDRYAAYVLSGFGPGRDELVAARVEAVEDIDVLAIVDGLPIERYYQVKSKDEGLGNWTLRQLETLDVLDRFFSLYKQFEQKKREPHRTIELVFAVEGDLNNELTDLRLRGWEATECRCRLFAWLCLGALGVVDPLSQYAKREGDVLRLYVSASDLLRDNHWRFPKDYEPPGIIRELIERSGHSTIEVLNQAAGQVGPFLEGFITCLRFDSRLASLGERTHARLLERGDLSPDEARAATDRLERAIYDESIAQEATDITPEVLSNWLGNPPREVLQSKPEPPPEKVHRGNLLRELRTRLETESGLLLHGLPKVGESQVISELITECGKEHEYFWFTFAGEHNETERLLRQLVVWIGRQTGVWKIKDDVYAGLLQPVQVFSRIGGIPLRGVWIILDDCHRLEDHAILGHLRTLTGQTWQESRLILASEEKLPVASELGIAQVPIHGFEAKEALEFVQKLGLDVSLAFLEFAMLAVRVDGHPVLLRAAVNELPHRPSSAEMSAVTERLPAVERVKGFLDGLSNQILFGVIRSAEQRAWLSRMAVLTLSFTQSIAFKLAALGPSIAVTEADWRYLSSLVLDQTGADRYSVPPLIRQLATSETDTPSPSTILTATSRHIFATAQTTGQIDFLDFQAAIFSLLLAEAYEEAAMRLILTFPSFAMAETFEPFEFLFVVLNGPPVHAKLPDPATRWMLLNAEVGLRLRDAAGGSDPKIAPLLGRMRLIFHEDWGHAARKLYSRVMHHLTACFARLRRAADTRPQPERSRKLLGSVESALRLSLISGDEEQILEALRIYDGAHRLPVGPNSLESLRQALLRVQRKDAVSGEGLVSLYEQFVARAPDVDAAVQVLREHSAQYLHAGLTEAHFACIHAEGVALLNRLQRPQRARELILPLAARASELGLSAQCIGTAELLIADTFWAEKDYAKGSSHYERALDVKFADPSFEEYITERLCDSWINLGRYQEAADLIIQALRSRRSRLPPECVTELWARLVYDFTLCQDFRKAAISCVALSRTLEHTNSDELRARVVKVIAWALAQIDPSDSAAVPGGVEIANPSALSERCPPEQVQKLREIDPFQTTAVFLTAVIFELAGELRRSEALLRKALSAVEVGDSSSQIRLFQLVTYTTRILRVQIGRRRFANAAASFKEALAGKLEVFRLTKPELAQDGPIAVSIWDQVEPAARGCTDEEVVALFDALCDQFGDNCAVCAWLRYREGNALFERDLVQTAKRQVLEAECLAGEARDKTLAMLVAYEKLFTRVEQFYPSGRQAWLVDALKVAVVLASDEVYAETRDSFANNVRAISSHQAGRPFDSLNLTVARFEGQFSKDRFLVIAYAMWRAATEYRLLVGSLGTIEAYLRQNANFLTDDDFR